MRETQRPDLWVVVPKDGYVDVRVQLAQPNISKVAAVDRVAACTRNGRDRALLCYEGPDPVFDKLDAYGVGQAIVAKLRHVRLAVHIPGTRIAQFEDMVVHVACSGGATLRYFGNRDAALHWLLQGRAAD